MGVTVPEGYKQTKVGVIPEDWEEYQLKDILHLSLESLKMEDENEYELITVRRRFGGVDSRGIFQGKEILVKNQFYVRENDFVISKRQISHGACGLIPKKLDGAIVSNEYNVFKVDDRFLDPFFLNYYVRLPKFSRTFYSYSDGVHIEKLLFKTQSWLKQKIPFPPLKEQKKIAQILTTWDEAISKQEALIAEKEQLKKGLMQKLLSGEVRFKGFDGEWEEVKLGDVGTFKSGFGFPENHQGSINQKYPFYKVSDMNLIGNEVYMKHENHSISEDILKQLKGKTIPKNSIIFAKVGAALLLDRRRITTKESCLDNNMMAFIPNRELIDTYFIYSKFLMIRFAKLANVGALPSIGAGDLKTYKMVIPSKQEQQKIAQVLSTADKEIELLKKELEVLKEQKWGLMQKLLTGEVRV